MFTKELLLSLREDASLDYFANEVNEYCADLFSRPLGNSRNIDLMGKSLFTANERYLLHLGRTIQTPYFKELSDIVLEGAKEMSNKASFHYEELPHLSRARGGLIRFFNQAHIRDPNFFQWFHQPLNQPWDQPWKLCVEDRKMGKALYDTCRAQRTAVVLAKNTASISRIRGPNAVSSVLRTIMVNLRPHLGELALGALVVGGVILVLNNQNNIWSSPINEHNVFNA